MGATLGLDAKVYRQTTGSRATWGTTSAGVTSGATASNLDEVTCIKNVTYTIEKGSADVSTRGNNGWAAEVGTLKRASFNLECVYDPADTDMIALVGAFLTNANMAFAILSGPNTTVGSQGVWADFQVHTFDKTENLEEGQMITFTLKPTLTSVAPEWVKVTA